MPRQFRLFAIILHAVPISRKDETSESIRSLFINPRQSPINAEKKIMYDDTVMLEALAFFIESIKSKLCRGLSLILLKSETWALNIAPIIIAEIRVEK